MTPFDYVLLGAIALSMLVSLVRGFVREALSLLTWIVALWLALVYGPTVAMHLPQALEHPDLRLALAFVLLFVLSIMLGGVINFVIGQSMARSPLKGTDRLLGMLFGFVRGLIVIAVLVLLAGLTPLPQDPLWNSSVLLPWFQVLADFLVSFLPAEYAEFFRFHD